jgi:hypothetical protein
MTHAKGTVLRGNDYVLHELTPEAQTHCRSWWTTAKADRSEHQNGVVMLGWMDWYHDLTQYALHRVQQDTSSDTHELVDPWKLRSHMLLHESAYGLPLALPQLIECADACIDAAHFRRL